MTNWYAGTSGFSYKEWKSTFYPEDLPDAQMLSYYADHLPAVEINNTFYRMPRSNALRNWANSVPADFRFVIKASRRITHQQRLKEADESVSYLFDKLDELGDKLGAVLFQLPPYLRADIERLEVFLNILPKALPVAFEFRHESWFTDEVLDLLADRGKALCVSEDEKTPQPTRIRTTDWLYLRLRKPSYTDTALRGWLRRAGDDAKQGFAFFKHEDAGAGPAMAGRFLKIADGAERRGPQAARRAAINAKPKTQRKSKAGTTRGGS
jgi:uncharacterized protein YecE (DUF72 family)